jgi:hypothetical protein
VTHLTGGEDPLAAPRILNMMHALLLSAKRIQRVLRHKKLHTTERYIQHLNDNLRDTLDLISEKKDTKKYIRSIAISVREVSGTFN